MNEWMHEWTYLKYFSNQTISNDADCALPQAATVGNWLVVWIETWPEGSKGHQGKKVHGDYAQK